MLTMRLLGVNILMACMRMVMICTLFHLPRAHACIVVTASPFDCVSDICGDIVNDERSTHHRSEESC
jgi:hypothetical protein